MMVTNSSVGTAVKVQSLEEQLGVLSGALRAVADAKTREECPFKLVARTLSDFVGDGCLVHLLSNGEWLTPVALDLPMEEFVPDAVTLGALHALAAAPHHVSVHAAVLPVIGTGKAHLVPRLDIEDLWSAASPELARGFEALGVHSLLIVALRVRGEPLGLLTLVRFAPDSPPFDEEDRDLAQALADHAALAITNAHLLRSALREQSGREPLVDSDLDDLHSVRLSYTHQLLDEVSAVDPRRADSSAVH